MSKDFEKDNINIDDLVDFLVKRRDQNTAVPASTSVESIDEEETMPAIMPEPIPKPMNVESAPAAVAPNADGVAAETPELITTNEDTDEQDSADRVEDLLLNGIPDEEITSEQPADEVEEEITPIQGTPAPAKKKRGLFGLFRRRDEEEEDDDWGEWDLKPIGHYHAEEPPADSIITGDTVSDESSQPESEPEILSDDEFPEVRVAAETITMQVVLPSGEALPRGEAATRILPIANGKGEAVATESEVAPQQEIKTLHDQLPDQLSLEEMVRVEDIEPEDGAEAVDSDEDPEERLQRSREEKVRYFTLEEEEESNEVEEQPEEIDETEEFDDYQEAKPIAEELHERCRSSFTTLLFTGLLEFVLLILSILTFITREPPLGGMMGYLIIQLSVLVLMMGLNYAAIGRGLSGLFTLRANSDTAPALASVTALSCVLIHFANTGIEAPHWASLAGLLLTLCAAGHYARALGVRRNFAFVSYPGEKYAATLIEEENAVQEIGRRATGSNEEAAVGYFHRTEFLTDYITNAYEDHRGDEWSRWMTPIAFGLALLLSLVTLLGEGVNDFWGWLSVFTGMVCVSMQASHLAVQLPLNHCGKVMLSRGGFLVGWKAVRHFGQLDALVVDIADLYPDESMLLHGIKTFSGTHIDEAILTAASLVVRSGGPLAMIFRRIIENKEELLSEVESLVYEQGMGISGWVDGRRVFVGNRRLLQNHGVDVPSMDYEARYAKDGRRLVYLSLGGQLSAMFVVSYLPDPEIQDALQDLCRSRVTLLVRSCDPNITSTDLCESFGLDEYYVDVLPASAGRAYMQLVERTKESMPAVMASNGHILGTAWALSVCRSLNVKCTMALIAQTIASAISLFLCLVWALEAPLGLLRLLLLAVISLLTVCVIPLFKRT